MSNNHYARNTEGAGVGKQPSVKQLQDYAFSHKITLICKEGLQGASTKQNSKADIGCESHKFDSMGPLRR